MNNEAIKFGYFTDHLSICNLVYNQKTGDGDFIKKFGSLKKTNLGCVRNHQAIANFSTGIPRLYSSGKQTRVCMNKSAFSRYPKHSDFADSVREELNSYATQVQNDLQSHIDDEFDNEGLVHKLMTFALADSVDCFRSFNTFLDHMFQMMIKLEYLETMA